MTQVFGTHSLAEMRLIVTPGTIVRWQAAPLRPLPDGVTDLDTSASSGATALEA